MKKIFSLFLVVVLLLGCMSPSFIFAEESLPDQDGLIDFLEYYNDSGRFPVEFDHTKPDFYNYTNDRNKTLYNAIMTSRLGVHYSKYPGNESLRTCFTSYSSKQESDENTQYLSWTLDPRGLCNKNDNYMYYRYDADKVDWIAKNIFNCSEEDCDSLRDMGESACSDSSKYYRFYCQDGYYYDITHYASGEEGYPVVTINAFVKKGDFYYIEYNSNVQPYSQGAFVPTNTTYYAKMQYKEIDGSMYWTLYEHSKDPLLKDNTLDFTLDVWNFGNYGDSQFFPYFSNLVAHKITDQDKASLLEEASPSERAMIIEDIWSGTNGHCYGMAATVILAKMGLLNISDYDASAGSLHAAAKNEAVTSLICTFHISQDLFLPKIWAAYYYLIDNKTQIEDLCSKAELVKFGEAPVLLSFGNSKSGFAHAVVAYGIAEGAFTGSQGKNYDTRVLLYDSNTDGEWNAESSFLCNRGTDEWEVPYYANDGIVSTSEGAYIGRVINDLSYIDYRQFDGYEYSSNYAELINNGTENKKLIITKTKIDVYGKKGVSDETMMTYNEFTDNVKEPGALHIILPEDSKEFSLETESGKSEEFNAYVKTSDRYLSVKSNAAKTAFYDKDGTVEMTGNEGDFEIVIADDTADETQFNTFYVSGTNENTGDYSLTFSGHTAELSGDHLKGVSVEATDGEMSDSVTLDTNAKKVILNRSGDQLTIEEASPLSQLSQNVLIIGIVAILVIAGGGFAFKLVRSKKLHKNKDEEEKAGETQSEDTGDEKDPE